MKQRSPGRKNYLKGESFVPHRLEMLRSAAWRNRTKSLAKVLDRLETEHMWHGGKENGNLRVSYGQFMNAGVSKKDIRQALELGERLGLLQIIQSEEWLGDIRPPNLYRLTYVPAKGSVAPTDEWFFLTDDMVDAILASTKSAREAVDGRERTSA